MERLDRIEAAIEALFKSQAKTDAQLARTDAKLQETTTILSNIGINLGMVAEVFFYHSLNETKTLDVISFDEIDLNVKTRNKKVQDEFDIVMYNGNTIANIEIKHKVHPNDIVKLQTQKLNNFKILFPDYANYKFYLGIGGMSVPDEVAEMAKMNGITLLRQKGELAQISDDSLRVY